MTCVSESSYIKIDARLTAPGACSSIEANMTSRSVYSCSCGAEEEGGRGETCAGGVIDASDLCVSNR